MQHLQHRGSISRSSRARRSIVSRHSRDMLNAACCETLEQRRLLAADVPNDFVKLNTSPIVVGTESAAPVSTGITLAAGENFYFVASGSHQLATNPTRAADAQYYQRGDLTWAKGNKPHLRVNGVGYWGVFDSSHVYGAAAVGNGAELQPWVNDSYYGDNAGTLSLDVYQQVELQHLKVTDAADPANFATDDGGSSEAPVLYVAEDANHQAVIDISGLVTPDTSEARSKAMWRIDEPHASKSQGNFIGNTSVELTVFDEDREWTIQAGVDGNGNGILDDEEVARRVNMEVGAVTAIRYMPTGEGTIGDLDQDNPSGEEGTPDFEGGYRLFADAPTYAQRNDKGFNVVRIRATVEGANEGDNVYFRSFDVDDPSTENAIDPNGAAGNDNRGVLAADWQLPAASRAPNAGGFPGRLSPAGEGMPGAPGAVLEAEVKKDAQTGELYAEVDLITSFSPGDNFRVAASMIEPEVNKLSASSDDADYYVDTTEEVDGFAGAISDQLSIWRRFHVEREKMKKVDANGDPLGDQASGEITLLKAPAVGFRTITIRLTRAASPNEFASGILRDSQNRNFWITGNSATDGNMLATFTIIDTGAPANGPATAYQDDFGVGDVRYSPFFNSTAAAVAAGANPGEWVITLNTDLPANEQDGFVDGLFFVENGPPLSIVSHTTGAGTSITVQAQQQPIQQGANVILVRPVSHEAPTTIVDPSDDGHLYEMMQASTVRAENRFADAYFEPRTDTLDAHISDVPGVTHLADNAVDFPQVFNPLRSDEKTKLFWTVQVSTAYEGRASKDLDPQTEGNSVLAFSNNYSTAIFLETIRDLADLLRATSESEMIARTTVHEVGHQFDIAAVPLEHRDDVPNIMMSGILVDNNNDPIGGSLLIPDNQFYFAAADIAFLRMRDQSPGAVV